MIEQQQLPTETQNNATSTAQNTKLDLLRANNKPYRICLMTELNNLPQESQNDAPNIRTLAFVKGYITRSTMYDIWDNIKVRKQHNQLTFTWNPEFKDLIVYSDNILATQQAIAIIEKDDECMFVDLSKITQNNLKDNRLYFFLGSIERIEKGIPFLFSKVVVPAFNLEYDQFIKTRLLLENQVYNYGSTNEINKSTSGEIVHNGNIMDEEKLPLK